MSYEKSELGHVLRTMKDGIDGRTCIAVFVVSLALLLVNAIWPPLANTQYGNAGKWIAVWIVAPFISFLVYLRLRQLVEGDSSHARAFRSFLVGAPSIALSYFNFFT